MKERQGQTPQARARLGRLANPLHFGTLTTLNTLNTNTG